MYRRRHFNLLRELMLSQLEMKNQNTLLGFAWSFLNPLLMLLVIFTVFNFRIGQNVEHYAVYLLIGIVQYTHASNSISAGMGSLFNMRQLAKGAIFPKELIVAGTVFSRALEFLISMAIAVAIAAATGVPITGAVLLLPLVIVLQLIMVLWIALLLAVIYPRVRDIEHIVQVGLRILFFVTPIFYTRDFLVDNELALRIIDLNPLTQLIDFSRALILEGRVFDVGDFTLIFALNLAALAVSYRLFKRNETMTLEYM